MILTSESPPSKSYPSEMKGAILAHLLVYAWSDTTQERGRKIVLYFEKVTQWHTHTQSRQASKIKLKCDQCTQIKTRKKEGEMLGTDLFAMPRSSATSTMSTQLQKPGEISYPKATDQESLKYVLVLQCFHAQKTFLPYSRDRLNYLFCRVINKLSKIFTMIVIFYVTRDYEDKKVFYACLALATYLLHFFWLHICSLQ